MWELINKGELKLENKALNYYENGFNCAQSVLKACNEHLKLTDNEEDLIKASMGLGTGMFLGETCGAVTGAIMALSLKLGSSEASDRENMRKVFKQIKIFEADFKEKNCSMNCKELKTVHKIDCKKVIKDSVKQIEKQIEEL